MADTGVANSPTRSEHSHRSESMELVLEVAPTLNEINEEASNPNPKDKDKVETVFSTTAIPGIYGARNCDELDDRTRCLQAIGLGFKYLKHKSLEKTYNFS